VAAMVGALDKDLADRKRTTELDLAPLLAGSYAGLVGAELGRRARAPPPTAFYAAPPRRLLGANCAADFPGWAI